ncbi:Thyroid adenoma-associated protein-like [Porphyridium purpureum]|uniref:Thyroid adenoma-associated protein-like n=1 Tax=Porphyridium purpureum TaxID=35688 RepID=A0A5J4Z9N9_PORPP|nr:Thyroid adenoma-associated protein-like [Porphyridium purpureum]|eukprot:POR9580..scf295_1
MGRHAAPAADSSAVQLTDRAHQLIVQAQDVCVRTSGENKHNGADSESAMALMTKARACFETLRTCTLHRDFVLAVKLLGGFLADASTLPSEHALDRVICLSVDFLVECCLETPQIGASHMLRAASMADKRYSASRSEKVQQLCSSLRDIATRRTVPFAEAQCIESVSALLHEKFSAPWIIQSTELVVGVCWMSLGVLTCYAPCRLQVLDASESQSAQIRAASKGEETPLQALRCIHFVLVNQADVAARDWFEGVHDVVQHILLHAETFSRSIVLLAAAVHVELLASNVICSGDIAKEHNSTGAMLSQVAAQFEAFSTQIEQFRGSFVHFALTKGLIDHLKRTGTALSTRLFEPEACGGLKHGGLCEELLHIVSTGSAGFVRLSACELLNEVLKKNAPKALMPESLRDTIFRTVWDRWEEPTQGMNTQVRMLLGHLVRNEMNFDERLGANSDEENTKWHRLTRTVLLQTSWYSRSKYLILEPLLAVIPTRAFLRVEPAMVKKTLHAFGLENNLQSVTHSFLNALWRAARVEHSEDEQAFLQMTFRPIISCLSWRTDQKIRDRVTEVTLPSFMRSYLSLLSSDAKADRLQVLVTFVKNSLSEGLEDDEPDKLRTLRVLPSVYLAARALGVSISLDEISLFSQALHAQDPSINVAAIEFLSSESCETRPMSQAEMALIRESLYVFLFPGFNKHVLSRFRYAMKRIVERLFASWQASKTRRGCWVKERKKIKAEVPIAFTPEAQQLMEEQREEARRQTEVFLTSLMYDLAAMLNPLACRPRVRYALELLTLFLQTFREDRDAFAMLFSSQWSEIIQSTLLLELAAECDVTRRLALDLLVHIPAPLHKTVSSSSVEDRVPFLESMTERIHSPKTREAQTGALQLELLLRKTILADAEGSGPLMVQVHNSTKCPSCGQGADKLLCLNAAAKEVLDDSSFVGAAARLNKIEQVVRIVHALLRLVHQDLDIASTNFTLACRQGLVHGKFGAIVSCLELLLPFLLASISQAYLTPAENLKQEDLSQRLRSLIQPLLIALSEAWERTINITLQGVAYREPNVMALGMGCEDAEDDDATIIMSEDRQKVITACFLSIKQLTRSMEFMVLKWPNVANSNITFKEHDHDLFESLQLDAQVILKIGRQTLPYVLCQARHTGVFDHVANTLQTMYEVFRKSENAQICCLPSNWLKEAFDGVLSGQGYALRRSGGLAAWILALLNSEKSADALNSASDFVMIITSLLDFLESSPLMNEQEQRAEAKSAETGMRELQVDRQDVAFSHALNILRLIFDSRMLGESAKPYTGRALQICLSLVSYEEWLVRNSSSLLFSALVRRLRPSRENVAGLAGSGSVALQGSSGREFFSSYPEFRSYAERRLRQGLVNKELFHFLIVFCCLAPGQAASSLPSVDFSMTASFLPPVMDALGSSSDYVRKKAARACIALVGTDSLDAFCIVAFESALQVLHSNNNKATGFFEALLVVLETHEALMSLSQKRKCFELLSMYVIRIMGLILDSKCPRATTCISPWTLASFFAVLEFCCVFLARMCDLCPAPGEHVADDQSHTGHIWPEAHQFILFVSDACQTWTARLRSGESVPNLPEARLQANALVSSRLRVTVASFICTSVESGLRLEPLFDRYASLDGELDVCGSTPVVDPLHAFELLGPAFSDDVRTVACTKLQALTPIIVGNGAGGRSGSECAHLLFHHVIDIITYVDTAQKASSWRADLLRSALALLDTLGTETIHGIHAATCVSQEALLNVFRVMLQEHADSKYPDVMRAAVLCSGTILNLIVQDKSSNGIVAALIESWLNQLETMPDVEADLTSEVAECVLGAITRSKLLAHQETKLFHSAQFRCVQLCLRFFLSGDPEVQFEAQRALGALDASCGPKTARTAYFYGFKHLCSLGEYVGASGVSWIDDELERILGIPFGPRAASHLATRELSAPPQNDGYTRTEHDGDFLLFEADALHPNRESLIELEAAADAGRRRFQDQMVLMHEHDREAWTRYYGQVCDLICAHLVQARETMFCRQRAVAWFHWTMKTLCQLYCISPAVHDSVRASSHEQLQQLLPLHPALQRVVLSLTSRTVDLLIIH